MTTKHSPVHVLKQQAAKIAQVMKAAERGENVSARVIAARQTPSFKTAIAMDDKLITIDIKWTDIRDMTEHDLADYIVQQMREII